MIRLLYNFFLFSQFHDFDRFTIHGAWPTEIDGSWHQYCYGGLPEFNETKIMTLEPRLKIDWPSKWESSYKFHEYEWAKHGTCANMTEFDYFSKILDTYDKYNINTLYDGKSAPDVTEITKLFFDRYQKELIIAEQKHKKAIEVRYCLDKQWIMIQCPESVFDIY